MFLNDTDLHTGHLLYPGNPAILYAAVALVQDKSLFGSAPKDIVDAIQPREERFKGARFLGWSLIILSMLILVAVAVIGIWDGEPQATRLL